MTTYIQVPDNLKDKSIKIVSTKYCSDEANVVQENILNRKVAALEKTIEDLTAELNQLSSTTQQYINANVIATNNQLVQADSADTNKQLAVTGNNNAESEIMTWADGSKTKDYRYVLATGNSSDTYMTHIEYVVPSNSELLTRFGIRKITRNAIDYSCVQTTITFSNGKTLTINGIMSDTYGGPFISYNEMPYHIGYFGQIWNNSFDSTVSSFTILTINTYSNNQEEDWILLQLENSKLTFWKRHWIYD